MFLTSLSLSASTTRWIPSVRAAALVTALALPSPAACTEASVMSGFLPGSPLRPGSGPLARQCSPARIQHIVFSIQFLVAWVQKATTWSAAQEEAGASGHHGQLTRNALK